MSPEKRSSSALLSKPIERRRAPYRTPGAGRTVAALARGLGRDEKRVHEDVDALVAAGLLVRSDDGLRADYDRIETAIMLSEGR